ncbi:MAG: tetratricopeptide repeat protein [Balneola sp.]
MKKTLGYLLFLLLGSYVSIVNAKVNFIYVQADSIEYSQVSLKTDSTRIDVLIIKIREVRFSNPELAKMYADTALELSQQLNLKSREAEIFNQLGIMASVKGDSPNALQYFLRVLEVRQEIEDLSGVARIQNNLGILYKNLGDFERSLQFHSASLESKKEQGDSLGIARSLNNIGEIFQQQEKISDARSYFEESLELMLPLGFKEGLAAIYNNLGEVNKLEGDISKAIQFHEQSLLIEKELGNSSGVGFSYMNIASLFLLVDQPEIAIKNYKEAVLYFKQVNDLSGLQNAYKDLASTYSELENFQESLHYFQLQSGLKDSLVSVERNRQIAELQTKYESEKQKQEIELLNERSAMQEAQISQQAKIRNLLVVITALLFVLAFILYKSNKTRKKANTLLVQKNRQIEEATELKAQFLSVMSHEIRTPMNAVVGMTNLLLSENPREDQKGYLDTLLFSSNNLLSIVNDVLDYNKAESGKVELESINFRPLFLLSGIYQSFYHESVKKGIHFKIEHEELIPEFLKGDPTRLTQILNNLISNAVKFTEEGSVVVDVSLADQTETTATVNFRITDTGIGIPADKVDAIFESFIQASRETHRKYGGSGLGLAITKKLAELYGSTINVVSTEGKGTSFSFSITFEKGSGAELREEDKMDFSALESLKHAKVLLVEDNPVNVQVIRRFLNKWDINPSICENGERAVSEVQKNSYDVVLMDLHMPVMDGYEATRQIRALKTESISTLPIVALTASNVFEEHANAYESGVNEIVPKPFEPGHLYQTIFKYTKKESIK